MLELFYLIITTAGDAARFSVLTTSPLRGSSPDYLFGFPGTDMIVIQRLFKIRVSILDGLPSRVAQLHDQYNSILHIEMYLLI